MFFYIKLQAAIVREKHQVFSDRTVTRFCFLCHRKRWSGAGPIHVQQQVTSNDNSVMAVIYVDMMEVQR